MHPRSSWWSHLDSTAVGAAGKMESRVRESILKTHIERTLYISFTFYSSLWAKGGGGGSYFRCTPCLLTVGRILNYVYRQAGFVCSSLALRPQESLGPQWEVARDVEEPVI